MESQTDGPIDRPVDGHKQVRVNEALKLWSAHALYFMGVDTCYTGTQILIENKANTFKSRARLK